MIKIRCTYPLSFFRFVDGNYKICPTGTESYYDPHTDIKYNNPIAVPCGKCMGCRLDNASQWTARILMEMPYHEKASFVTLTYDEEHLPRSKVNPSLGTLCKRDIQLFMKRLRKKYPDDDIRYYCGAEYGPQTLRPHYHMIIFGYEPSDPMFWKKQDGHPLYTSEELSLLWGNGFISFGKANNLTANYCARYCTSKLTGDIAQQTYYESGLVPPFQLASRAPALGYRYFYDHIDKIGSYGLVSLPTETGCKEFSVPRYFYKLLEKEDPEKYALVKSHNAEIAEIMQINEDMLSWDSGIDRMERKAYNLKRDTRKHIQI